MQIDISKLPYKHRFAAATALMTKGNKLTGVGKPPPSPTDEKARRKILEGLSYYHMALSLIKPHDPNYQTLLNWKCMALISLEQYKSARLWYEELVRIAIQSEGAGQLGPTAEHAQNQVKLLSGKKDAPLPEYKDSEIELFDNPMFCVWGENFCELLANKKYKDAHAYLAEDLGITTQQLKKSWLDMLDGSKQDVHIFLETFEVNSDASNANRVGWCYFVISNDDVNEAIAIDVSKTRDNSYAISSIEFGRP